MQTQHVLGPCGGQATRVLGRIPSCPLRPAPLSVAPCHFSQPVGAAHREEASSRQQRTLVVRAEAQGAAAQAEASPAVAAEPSTDAQEAPPAVYTPMILTPAEKSDIYGACRELLKLGRPYAGPRHVNALTDLLRAHKVVRVRVNEPGQTQVFNNFAADFAQRAGCDVIFASGRFILFKAADLDKDAMMALINERLAKIRAYNEKRKNQRAAVQAKRAELLGESSGSDSDGSGAKATQVKPSKAKAGDKGGSGGQAYVDNVIRRSITSGPLTRDTLRKEFTSVAEQLYADSVEEAEAEVRSTRSARPWSDRGDRSGGRGGGTPGAFGRGRGGRGEAYRGDREDSRGDREGRSSYSERGSDGGRGGGRSGGRGGRGGRDRANDRTDRR